jgi:hypothetical protein
MATGAVAGSISGRVNCACGGLPAQDVYAIATDGLRFYVTQTVTWQANFRILGVPAGNYYVYSFARLAQSADGTYEPRSRFSAGYTKAVACGLTILCTDHSAVAVNVRPGADSGGVDSFDWYSGDFPLIPTAGPLPPMLPALPTAFTTAQDAAVYLGTQATDAQYVTATGQCPVNRGCFWLTSSRDGSGASYFIARAGANSEFLLCSLYLIGGGSAWRMFARQCGYAPAFPAVGATGHIGLGMGETGCVNVHTSPSLSAPVVACLNAGTSVTLDDGPNYVPSGLPPGNGVDGDSYWWHLVGRGWMVHPYLRPG